MRSLFLKTHNVSGMKYLGKTSQDPYTYAGSGTVWREHLKEHGNNVSTQVLFESDDLDEFSEFAKFASEELGIVASEEFANSIPENGGGKVSDTVLDAQILVKLSKEDKQEFMDWCEENDTVASHIIRKLMREHIKAYKQRRLDEMTQ